LERQCERALLPGDRGYLRAVAQVDLVFGELIVPLVDDLLVRAGGERQRRAQRQDRRLRHHELAFLILVDRVGRVAGGFEQDVRDAELGRVPGGGETARPAADDRDLEDFSHGAMVRCLRAALRPPYRPAWLRKFLSAASNCAG